MHKCPRGLTHNAGYESKPQIRMKSRQIPVIAIHFMSVSSFTMIRGAEVPFPLSKDCIFNLEDIMNKVKNSQWRLSFISQGKESSWLEKSPSSKYAERKLCGPHPFAWVCKIQPNDTEILLVSTEYKGK